MKKFAVLKHFSISFSPTPKPFLALCPPLALTFLLVLLPTNTSAAEPGESSIPLLLDPPVDAVPPSQRPPVTRLPPAVTRQRRVRINPVATDPGHLAPGTRLSLTLFPDLTITATTTKISTDINGVRSIHAAIPGKPLAAVKLSVDGHRLLGSIDLPLENRHYRIRQAATGPDHRVEDLDLSRQPIPPGADPLIPPGGSPLPLPLDLDPATAEQPATIDIMVVYTPAASAWAAANANGIDSAINQIMMDAQATVDNNDLDIDFRLVHSAQVDYLETSPATDVARLRDRTDGFLDEIHDWRDTHGADLVSMLTEISDFAGIGYLGSTEPRPEGAAFTVVGVQYRDAYTFIHEIGHNLGAHHHREQRSSPGPNTHFGDYAAGWRWIGSDALTYGSVMTYQNSNAFSDGKPTQRLPMFSNPDLGHLGATVGHAAYGDNDRVLALSRHLVAAYRPTRVFDGPPDLEVTAFEPSTISLEPEAPFSVHATVRNRGETGAQATTLRLFRSRDATIDDADTTLDSIPLAALASDASVELDIAAAAPASAGSYFLGACVDPVSGETDTDNNCTDPVSISVASPTGDVALSPGEVYTTTLTGQEPGDAWRYFQVNVPADTAVLQVTLDGLSADADLYLLPAGKPDTEIYQCRSTNPGTLGERCDIHGPAAGPWWIGVANWTPGTIRFTVTASLTEPGPDPALVLEHPLIHQLILQAGDSFDFHVTVRNPLPIPAPTTTLSYHRSVDVVIDPQDPLLASEPVAALAGGGYSPRRAVLRAPATPGVHHIGACLAPPGNGIGSAGECTPAIKLQVTGEPCPATLHLPAGRWRMFGLPCDPGEDASVAEVLGDDLPVTGIGTDWWIMAHDPRADSLIPLQADDILTPARGYWLFSHRDAVVDIQGPTNSPRDLPLVGDAAGRLNLLGNFFPGAICWEDAELFHQGEPLSWAAADPASACHTEAGPDCVVAATALRFDGASYQALDPGTPGTDNTIPMGEAVWVRVFQEGVTLRLHHRGRCAPTVPALGEDEWYQRLAVIAPGLGDGPAGNVLGQLYGGADGFDARDLPDMLPPAPAVYLRLHFSRPEWARAVTEFNTDLRAVEPGTLDYPFQVHSDRPRTITLHWEAIQGRPVGATLVDPASGAAIPAAGPGHHTVTMSDTVHRFLWRVVNPDSSGTIIFMDGFE